MKAERKWTRELFGKLQEKQAKLVSMGIKPQNIKFTFLFNAFSSVFRILRESSEINLLHCIAESMVLFCAVLIYRLLQLELCRTWSLRYHVFHFKAYFFADEWSLFPSGIAISQECLFVSLISAAHWKSSYIRVI